MTLTDDLRKAARAFDEDSSRAAANQIVARVQKTGELLDKDALKDALTALRDNRWFDLLRHTTDRLMQAGDERSAVRKLYAQALIDMGMISAALSFLECTVAKCADDPFEYDDARGLLGRAWKQAYVDGEHLTRARGQAMLRSAAVWYYIPYLENRENYWHGINAVACLARAERDSLRVGDFPDWRDLARTIRSGIEALGPHAGWWDYSTAAEASLALAIGNGTRKEWRTAIEWLGKYVAHPRTSAFAVGGTLRQFTQVWQLESDDTGRGAPLLHVLKAALLQKGGGETLGADNAGESLRSLQAAKGTLQAILGEEQYKSLDWLRLGLTRASAVALIRRGNMSGTGFVMNRSALEPGKRGQVLITNHHVIPAFIPDFKNATVTFQALDGDATKYALGEQLWTSEINDLDATVLTLTETVPNLEPYPICMPPLPDLKQASHHVYVIGHPGGGTLSFSISDNLMIDHKTPKVHYRAPTAKGSSGSPVFDADWRLLALHHAGDKEQMRRLHGRGYYAANEGLYFPAIQERFARERRKSRK